MTAQRVKQAWAEPHIAQPLAAIRPSALPTRLAGGRGPIRPLPIHEQPSHRPATPRVMHLLMPVTDEGEYGVGWEGVDGICEKLQIERS